MLWKTGSIETRWLFGVNDLGRKKWAGKERILRRNGQRKRTDYWEVEKWDMTEGKWWWMGDTFSPLWDQITLSHHRKASDNYPGPQIRRLPPWQKCHWAIIFTHSGPLRAWLFIFACDVLANWLPGMRLAKAFLLPLPLRLPFSPFLTDSPKI